MTAILLSRVRKGLLVLSVLYAVASPALRAGDAATPVTPIPRIQGNAASSPLDGRVISTEGVVTAVFSGLSGYFLQDERGDGDASTSDGVFVHAPRGARVKVGQKVRITARVAEIEGVTRLVSPGVPVVLRTGVVVTPTDVTLPVARAGDLERYEGMLVRIRSELTVSHNGLLGRYGQLTLSAQGRLETPTNRHSPGSPDAAALRDANARRRIVLDDGSRAQNPNPLPFIGAGNTVRAGDTVRDVTGVVDFGPVGVSGSGMRGYTLHAVETPVFRRANARSARPADVGGTVRVASFNLLNFFTTIDRAGSGCFPGGARSDCRGADSPAEFVRQRDKIVAALSALDADVVGLVEIENNGDAALKALVAALNAAVGSRRYAAVGAPSGARGRDAIRVAMIYQPARVSAAGDAISDGDAAHHRPPLAQTFATAGGERFTVVVAHFKSKSCRNADGADADRGDGQGCWNARRVRQAHALAAFVRRLAASRGTPDVLVTGDLNAHAMEDPLRVLTDAGLRNLSSGIELPYSYSFDGEAGQLDHALASASLAARMSGITLWHINADEPAAIDYNTEFKPQDNYAPNAYRSSDHDPVLVGFRFANRTRDRGR
jgi:uncharacterized protein